MVQARPRAIAASTTLRKSKRLRSCVVAALASSDSSAPPSLPSKSALPAPSSGACLLDLGSLVRAEVIRRPSTRNKSPYVGDVRLEDGREAIAHMPSMDMGGKCRAGVACLLRVASDKKGVPVGAEAVGKYGTPKCEFIMQLVRVTEAENEAQGGVWVGAHPSLGEQIAKALLENKLLDAEIAPLERIQREVTGVAGTDMRTDFLLTHTGGEQQTVMEVKTVVDTDYSPDTPPGRPGAVFFGRGDPYVRAAIFPWGNSKQKGPEGEKVVSARAIKHVRELTEIARGTRRSTAQGPEIAGAALNAAVLFIVNRGDAGFMRPNHEACPSFARYLYEAQAAGVHVLAHKVSWGEGAELGKAVHCGAVRVELPPLQVD